MSKFFERPIRRAAWVAVGAIALGLGSCAAPTTSEAESPGSEVTVAPEDALQVVTTFLPMTQFTNAVAGDRAEVVQLLPINISPHEYQATPGDICRAIATADVLVKNGLEMEFFLDDMVENAGNAELAVVDSSAGVYVTLDAGDHGHAKEEGHDHGEEAHAEEHDHDHGEEANDRAIMTMKAKNMLRAKNMRTTTANSIPTFGLTLSGHGAGREYSRRPDCR